MNCETEDQPDKINTNILLRQMLFFFTYKKVNIIVVESYVYFNQNSLFNFTYQFK